MAINPIHLLTASTATATNGSKIIQVFGNVDTSRLYQGSVVSLGTFADVEAISGSLIDSDGNSIITLYEPWPEATTTARLTASNSIEGLTGAIEKSRQVVANSSAIEDLSTSGLVEKTGVNTYTTTPVTSQARAFLNDSNSQEQRATLELGTPTFPNPVEFGLGIPSNRSPAMLPVDSIDDLNMPTGFFRVINTHDGDRPDGFSEYGVLSVTRYDNNIINQQYTDVNNKIASRVVKSDGVEDWHVEFNSGNSINPLDFGLGTIAEHIQDFDAAGDNPRGSEFMAAQPSTQNQPSGSGTNNWAGFRAKRFNTSYFEFWAAMSENRYFARSYNSGYKDWAEFFTSENSVNPLDFGLKDALPLTSSDNLDDIIKSGFYYNITGGNTDGNNYPIPSAGSLIVISRGNNSSIQTQVFHPFNSQVGTTYTRTYGSGGWSVWKVSFDSGNSINPIDFGLGTETKDVEVKTVSNQKSGFFRTPPASSPFGQNFFHTMFMSRSDNRQGAMLQIRDTTSSSAADAYVSHRDSEGDWSEPAKLFHDKNSVNPIDFGIGSTPKLINSADEAVFCGVFIENNDNGVFNSRTPILNVARTGSQTGWQLACESGGPLDNNPVTLLARTTSGSTADYGEIVEILHDGNTNLDVFGSDGGSNILAQGVFVSANKATFLLPTSSNGVPFSITLGLGSFQVTKNGFNNVEDNIPPSRVVLGPRSSYKLAEIEIEGFSGQTSGDPVFLRTVDGSTKITVNF